MNLDTISALPIAQNLATIESTEHAVGLALELAALLERIETASPNVSAKVALAHAGNLVLDALVCLRQASMVARRDGR